MTQLTTKTDKKSSQKFEAAWDLLTDKTISVAKFEKIRLLLEGFNPQLDKLLTKVGKQLKKLEQIYEGDVISLTVEALPAKTKAEKKRKKALLAFLSTWKSFKSEVKRVRKLVDEQVSSGSTPKAAKLRLGTKILHGAKGPLGLITVAAVAVVAGLSFLKTNSVTVTITNQGCDSLTVNQSLPLSLPGLTIPQGEIPDGATVQAELPPLTVTVASQPSGLITLSALSLKINFELDPGTTLSFNDQSLMGQTQTIKLGEKDTHFLVIACR
ncbi:MAG: hypothetical protein UY13_C0002G0146 [Candidatus Pacebacteria bacterium GW2011_GWB1_47_8]|nr:MAG: hypothetical protein UX28_C0001G0295 [Candidatus Pacebacteria bacterium GW2011_GWA1_46_10]KKU84234.1 MAG: hypothetical protein UY13_C0002G0146 [Candidatus Pacebacteria bacterium GW2011_GWB1_47_8]HCR81454.1 hypothetical protein [Candidatus Paceibacterota bacterium]